MPLLAVFSYQAFQVTPFSSVLATPTWLGCRQEQWSPPKPGTITSSDFSTDVLCNAVPKRLHHGKGGWGSIKGCREGLGEFTEAGELKPL